MSYSFHIGNGKSRIITKGNLIKVSKHNERLYKDENFSKENIVRLVGTKNILNDVALTYELEFSKSVSEYNEKQKREDRKIDDYFEKVSQNKDQDLAVELIIQIGDKSFWDNKKNKKKNKEFMNKVYSNQITKLNELIPDFKVSNATIHYDEASPHLHIVGVPVSNFEKGLKKRVSKSRVFTRESLTFIQDKMRENLEEEMQKEYEDFSIKPKEKGRNKDLSVVEYKALLSKIKNLELNTHLDKHIKYLNKKTEDGGILKKIANHITIKPTDLNDLKLDLEKEKDREKILKKLRENAENYKNFENDRLEKILQRDIDKYNYLNYNLENKDINKLMKSNKEKDELLEFEKNKNSLLSSELKEKTLKNRELTTELDNFLNDFSQNLLNILEFDRDKALDILEDLVPKNYKKTVTERINEHLPREQKIAPKKKIEPKTRNRGFEMEL